MDERIAIGVAQTGTFVPATRTDARVYIEKVASDSLTDATTLVKASREDLARQIKASLNKGDGFTSSASKALKEA